MLLVTAMGLAAKFYPGPGRWWVNDWGPASVAYVVFFMLLAFRLVPRRTAITPIADLEAQQDDLLQRLDELDQRVSQVLRECLGRTQEKVELPGD